MRTRNRRTSHSQRRKLVWVDTDFAFSLAHLDNEAIDLFTNLRVAGASTLGVTVIRTIVRITNLATSITAGDDVYWGLSVADRAQIGLNVAGAPNAQTAPEIDWAWRDHSYAYKGGGYAAYFPALGNTQITDVKAKRKVEEMGQTWCLSLTQNALGTAGNANWVGFVRCLVALP